MGSLLSLLAVALFGVELTQDVVVGSGIVTMVILMVLSGFFSSSEIAMFSLARHRIDVMLEEGKPGAEAVAELK